MATNPEVILTVDERAVDGAIQVSIGNERGGYRLAGPKYDGRGCQLLRVVLDERARAVIRRYLDAVDHQSQDSAAALRSDASQSE